MDLTLMKVGAMITILVSSIISKKPNILEAYACYVCALEQLLENKGHKINPHRSDAKIKPLQQRGGHSLPQVISEFAKVKTVTLTTVPPTDHKTCIQSSIGDIPKGSKITKGGKFICVFGIFREMCEFVELSKQLLHPLICSQTCQTFSLKVSPTLLLLDRSNQ